MHFSNHPNKILKDGRKVTENMAPTQIKSLKVTEKSQKKGDLAHFSRHIHPSSNDLIKILRSSRKAEKSVPKFMKNH